MGTKNSFQFPPLIMPHRKHKHHHHHKHKHHRHHDSSCSSDSSSSSSSGSSSSGSYIVGVVQSGQLGIGTFRPLYYRKWHPIITRL